MNILYTHSKRHPEWQVEAKAAIARLAGAGWDIRNVDCASYPDAYWKALAAGWGYDDLINVEQDIVVTNSQAQALAACSEWACTIPYRLKDGKWSIYETFGGRIIYYEKLNSVAWAGGSGLGLVKLSSRIQQKIRLSHYPVEKLQWWALDVWISGEMDLHGYKWHVHPDVARHVRPNID